MKGARGEVILEAEGASYPVLFTNRALAQAEQTLGKPILQLVAGLSRNELGIGEVARLLAVGLEFGRREAGAGGRVISLDDAWRLMDVLGFAAVTTAVVEAIAAVLTYGTERGGATGGEPDGPPRR